jgi:mRNA interferase MazF
VVSRDVFNDRSGKTPALAVRSQPRRAGFPLTLEIESGGPPKKSRIEISRLRTLSRKRLDRKIGRLMPKQFDGLVEGLTELAAD